MQPHQERVISERAELAEKVGKLGPFLFGNTFNGLAKEEQDRLVRQFSLMKLYVEVLDARIAAF